MSKDKILAGLADLTPAELKQVAAVALGLAGGAVKPAEGNDPEAWLRAAISAFIGGGKGMWAGSNFASREFNKRAPATLAFLNEHFADVMGNKITALALMRYMLRLLADDLKANNAPVSYVSLSRNLHRMPQVFENAFPGYAADKAAMLILATLAVRT